MEQPSYDSSVEELSAEELKTLASMKRQEPQGEEHAGGTVNPCTQTCAKPLTLTNTDVSGKRMEIGSSASSSSSQYSSEAEDDGVDARHQGRRLQQQKFYQRGRPGNPSNLSVDSTNSHSAYNTLIIHHNNSSLLADTWIPATHEFTSCGIGNRGRGVNDRDQPPMTQSTRPVHSYSNPYENILVDEISNNNSALTSSELSEIPRDYLNQLTVLKHLAKEVKDPIAGTSASSLLRSASFSKSQPDLTQTGQSGGSTRNQPKTAEGSSSRSQPPAGYSRKTKKQNNTSTSGATESSKQTVQSQNQAVAQQQRLQPQQDEVIPSVQILEILMRENAALNAELVNARRKIATIHKDVGARDWQHCKQKSMFWCTRMCGLTGAEKIGHGKCSVTGLCICSKSVEPPNNCRAALSYDYYEVSNCHHRQRFCTFGQSFPSNTSIPLVCFDEHQKKIRDDQRFMKYCVCFRN